MPSEKTRNFKVTGMSCAACSARVEKAVSALPGVDRCSVNLLTTDMTVSGAAADSEIVAAVKAAGYGIAADEKESIKHRTAFDTATIKLAVRLLVSICLLVALMLSQTWVQAILAAAIMAVNGRFFTSGVRAAIKLSPNMDTLVALGSAASYIYSLVVLICGQGAVYFESAAMIPTLITVGKMLESYSKGRTGDAIKSLIKLSPKTATVIRDGKEVSINADEVRPGDIFIVKAGESFPADGTVLEGSAAVDESALTGESIPVDKTAGDRIFAATINCSGYLKCEATGVGEATTLAQIIKLVSDAAASKAPIAKLADRVAGVFVPVVLGIAALTFIVWLLLGEAADTALTYAVSVLVISCPCSLGLATPVAIMVGSGVAAKKGVLFKSAAGLEMAGRIRIMALDKTGTITKGHPSATDIIPAEGYTKDELLQLAYSLEKLSEHPLARAIEALGDERNLTALPIEGFTVAPGNGLKGELSDGTQLVGGSLKYVAGQAKTDPGIIEAADRLSKEGRTPLLFAKQDTVIGIIAVADTVRNDSERAVTELKRMGIRVIMLTGDNEKTARAVGALAGVDEVVAGVLPDEKEAEIAKLQSLGRVAMTGDGINDAPALTRADLGIAIGAGTDVAVESADVVLVKSSLGDAATAIRIGRATLRNIKENLFWAFFYNTIGIPVAAGVFSGLGIRLSPVVAAAAMSLSSFCVVMNALRLNFQGKERTKNMKKTLKVEGMMCHHCEAHVQDALMALDGVSTAVASCENNTVQVTLSKEVPDESLKLAVEKAGYSATGIETAE